MRHEKRKSLTIILTAIAMLISFAMAGNAQALTCVYEEGNTETVRYRTTDLYRNWVEMGDSDEPSQVSSRMITQSVTMEREVISVDDDGSAVIEVTIQEASITLDKTLQGQDSQRTYVSTPESTTSTWSSMPELSGATYQVKLAADTTVLEIMGLDEAREELGISSDSGVVSMILSDDFVRDCHQRDFVISGVDIDEPADMMQPISNVMIKAQAIEYNFVAVGTEDDVVAVMITGEPIHVLPEGISEPAQPRDWGRSLIKEKSDMSEFTMAGIGQFNTETNAVVTDTTSTSALLVLLEENVFPNAAQGGQSSGNVMMTAIETSESFDLID